MAGRGKAAAASGAWIVFEDESGCVLKPPHAMAWGRRGQTPVVTVHGRGSGRVDIAGLTCYRLGRRSPVLPAAGLSRPQEREEGLRLNRLPRPADWSRGDRPGHPPGLTRDDIT